MADLFEDAKMIISYTRADAIEDGVLIDVTEKAKEAGFKLHTVVTQNVWGQCVAIPEGLESHQSEAGRLWDVLWLAFLAARGEPDACLVIYKILAMDREEHHQEHELHLNIGPGDDGEPVITIMFPEDD